MLQTYTVENMTPDSAATATAFFCGVKAQVGTVGVNQYVARGDCTKVNDNKVKSMLKFGMDEG